MTSTVLDHARPAPAAWAAPLTAFVAAASLSAFLLFAVQPMFAKMMLPTLGGAPAVWSVAMAFFQALLLAGYAYAHLLTRYLAVRAAVALHLCVLALAFVALPIGMAEGWGRPPANGEALWLIGVFFASVGLPFFAVSANGPLLQAWFAASGRKGSEDPYFLYAASNLGSFGALLAYPLVIEPFATLHQQSLGWTLGFAALAACIALAGFLARDGAAARSEPQAGVEKGGSRLAWVGLAIVPSGLLVAVTAHISTDVAAMPMLWVVPLALFLLSFVIAFRTTPLVAPERLAMAQVWLTAITLVGFVAPWPIWFTLPLHLVLFLTIAVSAHGALFRRRPPAGDLTRFYLYMSLGGVLGGAFCSLAAPVLFDTVLEYPILLVAALACLPASVAAGRRRGVIVAAVASAAVVGLAALLIGPFGVSSGGTKFLVAIGLAAALAALWRRPERAIPVAAAAAVVVVGLSAPDKRAETIRSFFGVHKIATSKDGRFLTLVHGTTIHGAARLLNDDGSPYAGPAEPTAYYTREGGLGQAIATIREARGGALGPVAVVGLGTGSLACHAAPGERWRFFEIDEAVERIAREKFPFLKQCAPDAPVTLGDARLTLADEAGGGFSLIAIDAFSSDAIPIHLVTRDAIALYFSKLDPQGSALFHISNRHLDLAQILARAGAELGLAAYVRRELTDEAREIRMRLPTIALVLTRDPRDVGRLAADPGWSRVEPDMARTPWTDDFSNVLEAIRDKRRL